MMRSSSVLSAWRRLIYPTCTLSHVHVAIRSVVFCWNHIKQDLNGLCPACRRPYSEDSIEFRPVPAEEVARLKNAKKKKDRERKEHDLATRKQLANVRVVQKNLVYVLGLPPKLQNDEILRSHDYFGQYGKITKVVVNRRSQPHTASMSPASNNNGVYVTYARKDDATRAIDAVDGSLCEGRVVRATYGTTKYCSYFLKNQPCQNVGCQFLHEPGEEADTYVKDEIIRERSGQRLPSFPSARREEKEENSLPATASWAKTIHLNNHKQFPTLSKQRDGSSDGDSDAESSGQLVPLNVNDPRHYPALEPERPVGTTAEQPSSSKRRKQRTVTDSIAASSCAHMSPTQVKPLEPEPELSAEAEIDSFSEVAHVPESTTDSSSRHEEVAATNITLPERNESGSPLSSLERVPSQIEIIGSKVLGGEPLESPLVSSVGSSDVPRQVSLHMKREASPFMHGASSSSASSVSLSNIGVRLVPCYSGSFDPFQPNPFTSLYTSPSSLQTQQASPVTSQENTYHSQFGRQPGTQEPIRPLFSDTNIPFSANSTLSENRWGDTTGNANMNPLSSQASHPGLAALSSLGSSAGMSNTHMQPSSFLTGSSMSASSALSLRQQELLQHQQQQQQLNLINRLKIQQQQQQQLSPQHQQQLYARMNQQQQLLNQYSQQQHQSLASTNLDADYNAQYQLEQLREIQLRGQQQQMKVDRGLLLLDNGQLGNTENSSQNRLRLLDKVSDDPFGNDSNLSSPQQMTHFLKDLPLASREDIFNGMMPPQQQQPMKTGSVRVMTTASLALQHQLIQQSSSQMTPQRNRHRQSDLLGAERLQSTEKF
ncbi:hypothetical protein BASA83_007261 [Batrachochytrium salamandrivorans]|nr:hypothetical protein BASA83_007261 [Batrachochytrium salamandrivorans]